MAKHPGGRPTKYKPEYCDEIIAFFSRDVIDERTETMEGKNWSKTVTVKEAVFFPSIEGFAASIGVDDDTLVEWGKVHPRFSAALKHAKAIQRSLIYEYGLTGKLDSRLAGLFAQSNMGWFTKAKDEDKLTHKFEDLDDEQLDRLIKARQDRLPRSDS
jgi:hypothetical protein